MKKYTIPLASVLLLALSSQLKTPIPVVLKMPWHTIAFTIIPFYITVTVLVITIIVFFFMIYNFWKMISQKDFIPDEDYPIRLVLILIVAVCCIKYSFSLFLGIGESGSWAAGALGSILIIVTVMGSSSFHEQQS